MNNIKKVVLAILLVVSVFSLSAQDTEAPYIKGENPGLFPGFKKGFHPQISIAPQVGYLSFLDSDSRDGGLAYGLEIAMQCPLACTKKNYIRQQASLLIHTDDDFTFWTASLNPEYRFYVKPQFELAAGPALGLAGYTYSFDNSIVEIEDVKEMFFTYGVSTSATYHFNKVYVAVSPRFMLGKVKDATTTFNNIQGIFKVGISL